MTSTLCWDCGLRAHMTRWTDPVQVVREGRVHVLCGMYTCDNCHAPNLALVTLGSWEDPIIYAPQQWEVLEASVPWNSARWMPARTEGRDFSDVPAHIAGPASEAHSCHEVGANRAAIMVARAVVEATAKDKGITRGTLLAKIDALREAGHVRPQVAEMAHEVRHFGNDMAHGDFDVEPSQADASDVLDLMSEVLVEVYQSPARVAAIRERRAARNAVREAQ